MTERPTSHPASQPASQPGAERSGCGLCVDGRRVRLPRRSTACVRSHRPAAGLAHLGMGCWEKNWPGYDWLADGESYRWAVIGCGLPFVKGPMGGFVAGEGWESGREDRDWRRPTLGCGIDSSSFILEVVWVKGFNHEYHDKTATWRMRLWRARLSLRVKPIQEAV